MRIDAYRISELTPVEWGWEDPNGVTHENPLLALLSMLNFCGCGRPEDAAEYIRTHLENIRSAEWEVRNSAFSSAGERYFFWYWADSVRFTEHGGSVPGWLTSKGENFLDDLTLALRTWGYDDED